MRSSKKRKIHLLLPIASSLIPFNLFWGKCAYQGFPGMNQRTLSGGAQLYWEIKESTWAANVNWGWLNNMSRTIQNILFKVYLDTNFKVLLISQQFFSSGSFSHNTLKATLHSGLGTGDNMRIFFKLTFYRRITSIHGNIFDIKMLKKILFYIVLSTILKTFAYSAYSVDSGTS